MALKDATNLASIVDDAMIDSLELFVQRYSFGWGISLDSLDSEVHIL